MVCLVVGSNLPDADLLYSSVGGGPLTYVLQHRGYTHTLVGALCGAALLWFACLLWLRYRHLRATAVEQTWIAAAGVTGVLLHLAMDYTNSYGVHPFWPFWDCTSQPSQHTGFAGVGVSTRSKVRLAGNCARAVASRRLAAT